MNKSLIGIEIGSSVVSMVQQTPGGATYACQRLPENLVRDGRIVSPEMLASFLKEMKSEYGFTGKGVSILLPESATYFRAITLPVMTEQQLKLNLPYEFRDFVGNDSMRYSYDYALEEMVKDDDGNVTAMNMLAGAANKTVVEDYRRLLKNAGLRLKTAVPREMALIYLLRRYVAGADDPKREICLVDIGFEHTRIYISEGEKLLASKIIEAGCREIDEAIASVYNIDKYLAASYRAVNHENVLESEQCKAVYERIALEIMKTVNFYKYENQNSALESAYFCGSGAGLTELKDEICDYVQFEKKDVNELIPESCRDESEAEKCVMALGLTLVEE